MSTLDPSKEHEIIVESLVDVSDQDQAEIIADEFELSLRQIQRIASDYKDDYKDYLPSKK